MRPLAGRDVYDVHPPRLRQPPADGREARRRHHGAAQHVLRRRRGLRHQRRAQRQQHAQGRHWPLPRPQRRGQLLRRLHQQAALLSLPRPPHDAAHDGLRGATRPHRPRPRHRPAGDPPQKPRAGRRRPHHRRLPPLRARPRMHGAGRRRHRLGRPASRVAGRQDAARQRRLLHDQVHAHADQPDVGERRRNRARRGRRLRGPYRHRQHRAGLRHRDGPNRGRRARRGAGLAPRRPQRHRPRPRRQFHHREPLHLPYGARRRRSRRRPQTADPRGRSATPRARPGRPDAHERRRRAGGRRGRRRLRGTRPPRRIAPRRARRVRRRRNLRRAGRQDLPHRLDLLDVRVLRRRGRDRRRDRRGPRRQGGGGGHHRNGGQPALHRNATGGRRRAGTRPHALRADDVGRRRPTPQRRAARLPASHDGDDARLRAARR